MSNKKKKTSGERKPNWKEYTATVEDIQNFLMDRIVLRHNVITKRVEYRAPLSSSVANEGFAPLCGAAATSVAALKTPVAPEGDTIASWSIEAPSGAVGGGLATYLRPCRQLAVGRAVGDEDGAGAGYVQGDRV